MTAPLDDAALSELLKLREAGTAVPWRPEREPPPTGNDYFERHTADGSTPIESTGTVFALGVAVGVTSRPEDARLIAASVNALPALVAEIRELRKANDFLTKSRDAAWDVAAEAEGRMRQVSEKLSAATRRAEEAEATARQLDETARTFMRERDEARELLKRAADLLATEWRAIDGYDYHRDEAEKMETNLRAAITKPERP